MELAEFLEKSRILLDPTHQTKLELLKEMVTLLCEQKDIGPVEEVLSKVLDREKVRSTGFGRGLAVAHVRLEKCPDLQVALCRPQKGIDWGAQDGVPVKLVLLVIGADPHEAQYLQLLSEITKIWARKETQALLLTAQEPEEMIQIISEAKIRTHPRE